MRRLLPIVLAVMLLLSACVTPPQPTTNETEGTTVPQIQIHPDRDKCTVPTENVEGAYYYKCIGNRKLRIEYLPPLNQVYEKAPVVLMISGGGFMVCTVDHPITWLASEVKKLRDAGFAVASVEYRVGTEGVNVMQVYSDIADSMRYLSYYSDIFNIDPDKFVTTGHSAGGSASLAMAYLDHSTIDTDAYWPEADFNVVGAFSMSGHGTYTKTDYGPFNGYASSGARDNVCLYPNDEIRHQASPIYFLEGSKVPCKIFMGKMDNVVSPISIEKFKEACDAAGVPCELVWFEHAGHSYESMDGETVLPRFSVQKSKLVDFAKQCVEAAQS